MKLVQRIFTPISSFHDEILTEILKYPGCCDSVWLTTKDGHPKMQVHREHAQMLAHYAQKFREQGFTVSLQIANTIGHGAAQAGGDFSGLLFPGSPVVTMKGPGGEDGERVFCPRDRFFADYLCQMIALYAPIKPEIVWIDDDFRLPNHKPVEFGCFCDNCIAQFNTRYGTAFERSALYEEILYGDLAWRERWLDFQREGMAALMEEMMQVFHAISPDTVPGLQHAVPGGYVKTNHGYAFEPMQRVSGHCPVSRPGGGAYNDHDPASFIRKGFDVAVQNATLPPYVKETYPEIENIPHSAMGKSPDGTAFETSYYLACGANNMSYSMLNPAEPIEYYGRFLRRFAEQRPYWGRLANANNKSRHSGICCFVSDNAWERTLAQGEDLNTLHSPKHHEMEMIIRDGIPVHFEKDCADAYLLHPEEIPAMSDADIKQLLGKCVIVTGRGVELLQARGVELGVKAHALDYITACHLHGDYTDHPVNEGQAPFYVSPYIKGPFECYYFEDPGTRCEILGKYACDTGLAPLCCDKAYPFGISELLLHTNEGGRWLLLGFQPWRSVIPKARVDHLLDFVEYAAQKPLAARMHSPHQVILHPRCNEKGETVCVSVSNCTIGRNDDAVLEIRNPQTTRFFWQSQRHEYTELTATKVGNAYRIELPMLDAWTQGTVFCE